jgi:hypothetical protein
MMSELDRYIEGDSNAKYDPDEIENNLREQIARRLYEKHWGGNLATWTFERAEKYETDAERETFTEEADVYISLFKEYVKGCEPSALDIDEMLGDMTKERYLARHCTYQEASTLIHATISKVMEGLE